METWDTASHSTARKTEAQKGSGLLEIPEGVVSPDFGARLENDPITQDPELPLRRFPKATALPHPPTAFTPACGLPGVRALLPGPFSLLALSPQPLCGLSCIQRPPGRTGVSPGRRQADRHAGRQVAGLAGEQAGGLDTPSSGTVMFREFQWALLSDPSQLVNGAEFESVTRLLVPPP